MATFGRLGGLWERHFGHLEGHLGHFWLPRPPFENEMDFKTDFEPIWDEFGMHFDRTLNCVFAHFDSDLGSIFDKSSVAEAWRLLTLPLVFDTKFEKGT